MSKHARESSAGAVAPEYLIRVQGSLDKRWLDYFDGISIVVDDAPNDRTSTISAHPVDQAALFGLLNSLYDYGYPLLYVEKLTVA